MGNESSPKHSRLSHVPAILATGAAFVAAVSTLYVNLRSSPSAEAISQVAPSPSTEVAQVVAAPTPAAVDAAPKARMLLLRLDRVQVENDGSAGSTDWTFEVDADGEPRFTLAMPSLTDKPGKNLVRPPEAAQASSEVLFLPAKQVEISVKGWKRGFLPGSGAEISGSTRVNWNFDKTTVHVAGDRPKGPAFTLYFTLTPKP